MRGLGRIVAALTITALCSATMAGRAMAASGNCQLCIVEVHAVLESGTEPNFEPSPASEDYVIVYNRGFTGSATNIKLALVTTQGSVVSNATVSLGVLPVGQMKIFAGPGILPVNNGATSLGAMNLNPAGGMLQIGYFPSKSLVPTTIYDEIPWGTATGSDGGAGPALESSQTLARKLVAGSVQDTDVATNDFDVVQGTCTGAQITEVQPFVADPSGAAMPAWIELLNTSEQPGDCELVTTADGAHTVPAASMPEAGHYSAFREALDGSGKATPFRLGGVAGQIWLANKSVYGTSSFAYAPVSTVVYPTIESGQTWALIDGLWRATFAPTPNEGNVYQQTAPSAPVNTADCSSVRINELLPNPDGDDSGKEWLELYNYGATRALIGNCQVSIGNTVYVFATSDGLWAGEYRTNTVLYGSSGSEVNLSLPNSSDTPLLVSWQRRNTDGSVDTLQSFYLYDGVQRTTAPEGQSFARSDLGWAWSVPTPGLDNATDMTEVPTTPTEGSAPTTGGSGGTLTQGPVIEISELLPNPAAPLSDDEDEYVELYNPNSIAVNLVGYTLQTGSSFGNSFTFPDRLIAPGEYITITSGNSSLTLSNTAGAARLLEPTGIVVSQTDPYSSAPEGQAWAHINGTWMWTMTATPGATNVFVPPLAKVSAPTAKLATAPKAKSSTTKAAATKGTATAATKAAKTAKAATSATKSAATTAANTVKASPLHPAVLAVVGALAVLYAAYEYRTDFANRIYQFRQNRITRRENRRSSKGR